MICRVGQLEHVAMDSGLEAVSSSGWDDEKRVAGGSRLRLAVVGVLHGSRRLILIRSRGRVVRAFVMPDRRCLESKFGFRPRSGSFGRVRATRDRHVDAPRFPEDGSPGSSFFSFSFELDE